MLSDAKIKAAKPQPKAYKLSDTGQLYLFVSSAGGKLWRMNYAFGRNAAGTAMQKTLSFGSYPIVSLMEARRSRDEAKAMLWKGLDPAVERKRTGRARSVAQLNTFKKVAVRWHQINLPRWSKVHGQDVLHTLERDVFPVIGDAPIDDIRPPEVLALLSGIEDRGAIETARRVRQRMSAIFVYGMACGLTERDPAAVVRGALKPILTKGRQPAITDLAGARQILVDAEAEKCRAVTKLALRLLALTAVRPGELRGAMWSEIHDLDGASPEWRIPASRMKGQLSRKDSLKHEHIVPLAPQSVSILKVLAPLTGEGLLLFPNERHVSKPMSENALGYLLNRAGYHHRHVPHGWRATFSTVMNERATKEGRPDDRAVIDLMLAHSPTGVSGSESAYNRASFTARRREIANDWANLLVEGMPGPEEFLGRPMR
ncbi:MAG: integrase arm-type DNA-binding domain-containing protein [Sphingomicrobium sp.]